VSPLLARALLIHRAESSISEPKTEVGWGRVDPDLDALITCDDTRPRAVPRPASRGDALAGAVPLPKGALTGKIRDCRDAAIAPEVDPGHPSTYTRSGLEVAFRPNKSRFGTYKDKQG